MAPVIARLARRCRVHRARPRIQGGGDPAPSEALVAERMESVIPMRSTQRAMRCAGDRRCARRALLAAYRSAAPRRATCQPAAKGVRRLRTVALGLLAAGDAGERRDAGQGAVRRRRQHDRPPRRARSWCRSTGPSARRRWRLLRPLPRQSAGARQMVRDPGGGAAARHRSTRSSGWPTIPISPSPIPIGCARWRARSAPITGRSTMRRAVATPSSPT